MSSTKRSRDEKPEEKVEAEKKRPASPGRYSLADDRDKLPPHRIDSTKGMPAVRPSSSSMPAVRPSSSSMAAAKPSAAASPAAPPPSTRGAPVSVPRPPPRPDAVTAPPAPPSTPRFPAVRPSSPELNLRLSPMPLIAHSPGAHEAATVPPAPAPAKPPEPRQSSVRPAVAATLEAEDIALALDFDEGSIAFAFDALVSDDGASKPGTGEFDLGPVRELFAELAANHMRHVRDFMIDVKWGQVTRDWIDICVPPVRTLRRAAEHLELAELAGALEKVGAELAAANAVGGQLLDVEEKQRLLDAYEELVAILPQAFALDRDKTQREAVIVQALLLQVPDVRKVTIDKMRAAGLTSLTLLFDANAEDIAHVAGIPEALAERIVARVQAYRAELRALSPQDARASEREKLAGLHGRLKEHHDAYELAANGWSAEAKAKKRDHFLAREETWLEISVLLARFGEVDRLRGIEKVPFATRISQLYAYLEEARNRYQSSEG
jgi:hypothetical protein